jgi:hypothetical protein
MKYIFRSLFFVSAALPLLAAGDQLTGFPFQNETLHYNVNWSSGLSLGEVTFTATKAEGGGWKLDSELNVGVPGLPIADKYTSQMNSDFCSAQLDRTLSRGTKKNTEKTTFDQKRGRGIRQTMFPLGGGKTDFDMPACGRDALAALYFTRKELGQGRMPAPGKLYFGGEYSFRMEYTGAQNIPINGKQTVTDHVNVWISGPASKATFEIFFARDAARTPLLVKIPTVLNTTISMELAG